MNALALAVMAAGLSLPSQQMEIALRVAGKGLPKCQSYSSDGVVGSCLPIFTIRSGRGINGWSLAGHIAFSSAATVKLNDDEFALLAGHEIAHYYLGHKRSALVNELAADRLGAELACKAGYDPIAGASLFRHLRPSKVHPTSGARRDAVLSAGCQKK
jgi:hypothetical protein